MPTYDYECKECEHVFEVFMRISDLDDVNPKCPKCKSECGRLVSGGTGIIFKGSGFFINDYAKPGANRKEMEDKEKSKSED